MSSPSHTPLNAFIEGWGRMGTQWGVGKMMAEIQALLYVTDRPQSLEDMAERLKTSRSNISLNVRALQDLGVVRKVSVPGDRKDYYTAEANVGRMIRHLAAEKKRRELEPALALVDQALAAARDPQSTGGDGIPPGGVERLEKLRALMEVIAGVFDTFIDAPAERMAAATPDTVGQ